MFTQANYQTLKMNFELKIPHQPTRQFIDIVFVKTSLDQSPLKNIADLGLFIHIQRLRCFELKDFLLNL